METETSQETEIEINQEMEIEINPEMVTGPSPRDKVLSQDQARSLKSVNSSRKAEVEKTETDLYFYLISEFFSKIMQFLK